jgi:hypothetical protein
VFLVRAAFWLSLIILLMPTDERPQERLSGTAAAAVEQAATFCERNPSTCAAGAELWAIYLRKAEFALQLATKLVSDWMTKGDAKHGTTASHAPDQTLNPALDLPARDLAPQGSATGAPVWAPARIGGAAADGPGARGVLRSGTPRT